MTRYNKLESDKARVRRFEREHRVESNSQGKWSKDISREFATSKLTGRKRKGIGYGTLPDREL